MGYMTFKGVDKLERESELLNSFNWDFELITPPAGVYYPGSEIFKNRLKTVGGIPNFSHSVAEVDGPGGFKIIQTGDVDHNGAQITLTFVDYEDSSLFYMFRQWMDAMQDPYTHTSTHKSLVYCDINVYQLNTQLDPVYTWQFRTGMPNDLSGYHAEFTDKKNPQNDLQVSFSFEWWNVIFNNAGEVERR